MNDHTLDRLEAAQPALEAHALAEARALLDAGLPLTSSRDGVTFTERRGQPVRILAVDRSDVDLAAWASAQGYDRWIDDRASADEL